MPLSDKALRECIHRAGFPIDNREFAFKSIRQALDLFREHRIRRYYGATGKSIKKPTPSHTTSLGRYDQKQARFVLIAGLYRAWLHGFGTAPTLNNKSDRDSAFATFAMGVLAQEGIGRTFKHLEEYWSYASKVVKENEFHIEKWRVSGGTKDAS